MSMKYDKYVSKRKREISNRDIFVQVLYKNVDIANLIVMSREQESNF